MEPIRREILRVIEEIVAPLVRADGGKLYLVSADSSSVALHLAGRFAGCPSNTLATRRVIEPAILAVAPKATVTVTSGAIVPTGATPVRETPT